MIPLSDHDRSHRSEPITKMGIFDERSWMSSADERRSASFGQIGDDRALHNGSVERIAF
jgi:hypothetical protein